MMFAPVHQQETIPPYNNELQHAFQRLKTQSNIGYSPNTTERGNVPMKEPVLYQGEYGEQQVNSSTSVKYPELYSTNYSKYQELYSPAYYSKYPEQQLYPGQYDPDDYLLMFPVDTPNTIPTPATEFKQQHDAYSVPNVTSQESSNAAEPNLLTEEQNFDLNSLLAFPTPANKEQAYFAGNLSWELLEGLEQPSLEDMDLVNHLEANLPDEIHYWHGLQKDASYHSGIAKETEAITDPLVSSPMMEHHPVQQHTPTPMDHSGSTYHYTSLSPEASPHSGQVDQPGEVTPVEVVSPMAQGDTPQSAAESWGQNLRSLFEKTFDISDLADEFMVIPPDKDTTTVDHTPPDKKTKPPPLHASPKNSPSHERPVKTIKCEHTEDDFEVKPKPTLLFGKHEGEIIHKLLALKQGTRSKPVTRDKLIIMPVEDFNLLLDQAQLSEIEVAFMKEWRRRGKNKAAAQIARKRKRAEVSDLDQEVHNMRQQKAELEKRCRDLQSQVVSLKARSKAAEVKLYKRQSVMTGATVSRNTHHILITEDEELLLIPRANSKVVVAN